MQKFLLVITSVSSVVSFSQEPHVPVQSLHVEEAATGKFDVPVSQVVQERGGTFETPATQVFTNGTPARSVKPVHHMNIELDDFQQDSPLNSSGSHSLNADSAQEQLEITAATEQLQRAARTLAEAPSSHQDQELQHGETKQQTEASNFSDRQREMKKENEAYLMKAVEAYQAKPKTPRKYIGGGHGAYGALNQQAGDLTTGGTWPAKRTESEKDEIRKEKEEEKDERKNKRRQCRLENKMKRERNKEFKKREKKGEEITSAEANAPFIDDEEPHEELEECLGNWDKAKKTTKKAGNAVADAIGIAIQAYALLNGGFCPEEGLPGAATLIEPQWAFGMGCMYKRSCLCPPMYGVRDMYECANMPLWGELPSGWGAPFVMVFGFCRIPLWMWGAPIIMTCCYSCYCCCFYCKRKMNQEDEEAEWQMEEAQMMAEAGVDY